MKPINYVSEFDIFTFEEAQERFQENAELYGHLDPVVLIYYKGDFQLNYAKENENDHNENRDQGV